jgi:hypothetical protein
MASQYADALIQSMLMQRGGMTPGQAINQGTGQIAAALAARRESQQAKQTQQLQAQLAQQLLGGDPQALQNALAHPEALQSNPMLAQILMQQMAPEEAYTLAPGAVRMKGGKRVAENPAEAKEAEIIQKVRAAGYDPASPEGQKFAREMLLKPSVSITNEYGAIPQGYRRVPDPKSPTGTKLVKEEGGPQDKIPTETAAKLGMLNASDKSLVEAEGLLFKGEGYNRKLLTAVYSPVRTGGGAQFYNAMRDAVSNRLRAESGASITDQDVNDAMDRFMPKPWEEKAEAQARFKRFRQFISSYRGAVGAQPQLVNFEDLPP